MGDSHAANMERYQSPFDTSTRNPPTLFEPYQKYIPEAMNSNQPIYDPTSILTAYQKNMPEFRLAAQGDPKTPAVSQSLSARQEKK